MKPDGICIRWGYRATARGIEIRDLADPNEPVVETIPTPDMARARALAALYESAGLPPTHFSGAP